MEPVIRDIVAIPEMHKAVDLQRAVWGFDDIDAVGTGEMRAVVESGGSLIGAFDGEELIGLTYGWIGLEHGRIILHSHLAAVKPALQGTNIGYRLKMAQRDRMLARGIDTITWTVDPLQSRNAYLNFSKLGVHCDKYFVNFYGDETSSVLHRSGTDRFLVTWPLDKSGPVDAASLIDQGSTLVTFDDGTRPKMHTDTLLQGNLAIEIPDDINAILRQDKQSAMAWREATRWAFLKACEAGYRVTGYARRDRGELRYGSYLLVKNVESL